MTEHTIPTTTEDAIALLVEQDVAKWGEQEREAAQRSHQGRSFGLALNELANRAELTGSPDPELREAAQRALTSDDWHLLRHGG